MVPKTLLIVAHPDDEVLGCGGTIAKYRNSMRTSLVILGEGISSRYAKRQEVKESELKELQSCSQRAGKILGIAEYSWLNLPDNRFDTIPLLDIVKKIEHIISKLQPQRIYTHHPNDLNIDHRIVFQAVLTAVRPNADLSVNEIYSFEVPSSTEWSLQIPGHTFNPNVFEDISDSIETKLEALRIYKSELRDYPHPRSVEGLRIIAQRWGLIVGKEFVEPFELIRRVIS